jgi:hypothetical protein
MRLLLGLAALVLVACGGSEGSGELAGDGGPGAGEGGADASADAALSAEGGDGDASTALVDGGDGGAGDTRIDPIEVGRAWTYNVTVLGFYPACSSGVFTSNTLESSQLDGKTALHVQSLCDKAGVFKYSVDGDRVYVYLNGSWKISLDSPVVEGHTWSDGFRTYRWESKGSVTTPAGTFADCWSATTVASYTSYLLVCRGVGPVKWHYEDGLGNGYEAVLTAKNF